MSAMTTAAPAPLLARLPLRAVLWLDAAAGLLMALPLLAAAAPLAAWLGLPPALLTGAGLALLPVALLLALTARQQPPSAARVQLVVAINLLWALASAVLALAWPGITGLGQLFVGVQAVAVLALAVLEWRGLAQR